MHSPAPPEQGRRVPAGRGEAPPCAAFRPLSKQTPREEERPQKGERGHGYGMRSMRMVAEKYGGFLTAEVRGDLFILDIVIPFSPKEERKTE